MISLKTDKGLDKENPSFTVKMENIWGLNTWLASREKDTKNTYHVDYISCKKLWYVVRKSVWSYLSWYCFSTRTLFVDRLVSYNYWSIATATLEFQFLRFMARLRQLIQELHQFLIHVDPESYKLILKLYFKLNKFQSFHEKNLYII